VIDIIPLPFALYRIFKYNYPDQQETLMVVDIGNENTNIIIVDEGEPVFVRNINLGGEIFTKAILDEMASNYKEAEGLKIYYGDLGNVDMEVNSILRGTVGQIYGGISATISYARIQIKNQNLAPKKIYLSGGAVKLRGFKECYTWYSCICYPEYNCICKQIPLSTMA
jgi:type IV pilus assembly protein PilM